MGQILNRAVTYTLLKLYLIILTASYRIFVKFGTIPWRKNCAYNFIIIIIIIKSFYSTISLN